MTGAWVALAVLLVGLPLTAWWLGGRRFWNRLEPGSEPDRYRELVRRHALRPTEAAEVESAVTWGRELQDPRLRAAAVDWAQTMQADGLARSARYPWVRRVLLPLAVVGAVLGIVFLVHDVLAEGWSALGDHVWALVWLLPTGWLAAGPSRAIRRNRGPVDT